MLTRKCDICGAEMRITTPRYKVVFDGWLYTEEIIDICIDCFNRIAEEIKHTDLLVKTPHKSRESHEKNCETCRDKDAYDEWQGNCDECENGSMYTPQIDLVEDDKCFDCEDFFDCDEHQTDCPWR